MLQSLRIASRSAVTLIAALLAGLPLSAMAATTVASHGEIVVVTVHGTVDATMAGMTEWTAQYLAQAGYDYGQGYRYSPAIPAEECRRWIVNFNSAAASGEEHPLAASG
jgi:sensor c-di-GMP phosphodiesterase-like protein